MSASGCLSKLVCSGLLAAAVSAEPPAEALIPTYSALYEVEYKGRKVGASRFTVSYDAERGAYRFESHTQARGLLRLVSPKPIVERSDFVYRDGEIRPLEFWHEDGSRRGEDNLHVVFDWENGVALTTGEGRTEELEIEPGVLDQGSMQVAVMLDMASPGGPASYLLADRDSLKRYRYEAQGSELLETALGALETQKFVQQREGSSRRTLVWAAPSLSYLPVRMEQRRDGETQTAFFLQAVDGLGGQAR